MIKQVAGFIKSKLGIKEQKKEKEKQQAHEQ